MAGAQMAWRRLALALLAAAVLASSAAARPTPATPLDQVLSRFFTNDELVAHMKDFAARCAPIAKLHAPIGRSVRGFPLHVLEISDKPGQEEAEPHVKYIANMHGTETGGRQLLLALGEWLCANYNATTRGGYAARRVVNNMHLWLMPTMNPDGYADQTYENANGVNLNRDFPDPLLDPAMIPSGQEQPETKAVMKWVLSRQFVASANMHEGAFVANYPWDGGLVDGKYNATQDDATFRMLARTYASRNPQLDKSMDFPGGITNGAAWYAISGGMQDWNYVRAGCFEITLELWEDKGQAVLPVLFRNNLGSLLAYANTASFGGLRGTVKQGGKPAAATITVNGSSTVTRSGKQFGNFYRPLAPGPYVATVALSGPGRQPPPQRFNVTVPTNGRGFVLNVTFR